MSKTETHFGKLRKVEIDFQTLEQWCEIKCKEVGNTKIESYYNSWQEQAMDCLENKYFFVDDEVWEVIEHIESESGDDIDVMIPNTDGTIIFLQQFYNGGTCLSECIEDGIKRIKDKQKQINMAQAAVSWILIELQNKFPKDMYNMYNGNQLLLESLFLQAKAMGKEQMIDFAKQWQERQSDGNLDTIEMLYNETYNK